MNNYPPGVTAAHPHFNPPDEETIECPDCKLDVFLGEPCEECDWLAPTRQELDEAAADEYADIQREYAGEVGW